MSYGGPTQDERVSLGAERMASNQLGLSGEGPNSGNPHATYWVRDNDGVLVSERDAATGGRYYYVYDGLRSVVALTGASGTAVDTYSYEPYGKQTPSGTVFNPWGFAGGYTDPGTGMVKSGTRYYMPDLARWTQRDPVIGQPTNPMSLNPYTYTSCDPVNRTDTSGRSFWTFLACAAGALLLPWSNSPESFVAINIGGDIVATGAAAFAFGPAGVAAGLPLVAAGLFLIGYGVARQCG